MRKHNRSAQQCANDAEERRAPATHILDPMHDKDFVLGGAGEFRRG
jgi:hypothetical protein